MISLFDQSISMISVLKDLSVESENQSINQSVYVSCLVGLAMGEINSKPTYVSTKHNVSQILCSATPADHVLTCQVCSTSGTVCVKSPNADNYSKPYIHVSNRRKCIE